MFFLDPADGDPNRPNMIAAFTLTDNWLWKLRDFVEACGLNLEGGYDSDRLIGKRVVGYVVHAESKGKTYANVTAWGPYGGLPQATPPTAKEDGLPF
jgi:hypothetical protein